MQSGTHFAKLPISALAETDSFVLVEAPPQSP